MEVNTNEISEELFKEFEEESKKNSKPIKKEILWLKNNIKVIETFMKNKNSNKKIIEMLSSKKDKIGFEIKLHQLSKFLKDNPYLIDLRKKD
jgi:hypothetical protein